MTSLFKINSKLLFLITITFLISMTLAVLGKEEAVSWVNLNLESLTNYSVINPSSIGATLAFLLSRFLFKDYFRGFFNNQYEKINNYET